MEVIIPYKFSAREYQKPLIRAFQDNKYKRGVAVWHRRAGKDKSSLANIIIPKMMERIGIYYYFLPTYKQGKKIIWDGIDGDGFKFIDHFPKELVASKNKTEMKITLHNGSLFQVVGTDDIDSIVGTNPVGVVFSEYSLQNPKVWDFIRPILKENDGWAVFVYTPRGHNHAHRLYNMAKDNPNWFCELLTIEDTKVLTKEDVQDEIDEGMSDELAQQEYYCSFEGYMDGSYYHKPLKKAREDGRIGEFIWDSGYTVNTYWDLGIGKTDKMSVIFLQQANQAIRIIDYYESGEVGMPEMAKILQEKPYVYKNHYMPFDVKQHEKGTGKMLMETATNLGIRPIIPVPKLSIEDGIGAVRTLFPSLHIDETRCEYLLDCLANYHKEYDDVRKEFKKTPYHDWSSHGADSLRYLAVSFRWNPKGGKHSIYRPKQSRQAGRLGY